MAHLIIFEHRNFRGAHRHLFQTELDLGASDDKFFDNKMSSFVILEGRWQFHGGKNRGNPDYSVFLPGHYSSLESTGIANDSISSITLIAET